MLQLMYPIEGKELDKVVRKIPDNKDSVRLTPGLRVYWNKGEKLNLRVLGNQQYQNSVELVALGRSPDYVRVIEEGTETTHWANTIDLYADYEVMIDHSYRQAWSAAEAALRALKRLKAIRPDPSMFGYIAFNPTSAPPK